MCCHYQTLFKTYPSKDTDLTNHSFLKSCYSNAKELATGSRFKFGLKSFEKLAITKFSKY